MKYFKLNLFCLRPLPVELCVPDHPCVVGLPLLWHGVQQDVHGALGRLGVVGAAGAGRGAHTADDEHVGTGEGLLVGKKTR